MKESYLKIKTIHEHNCHKIVETGNESKCSDSIYSIHRRGLYKRNNLLE